MILVDYYVAEDKDIDEVNQLVLDIITLQSKLANLGVENQLIYPVSVDEDDIRHNIRLVKYVDTKGMMLAGLHSQLGQLKADKILEKGAVAVIEEVDENGITEGYKQIKNLYDEED